MREIEEETGIAVAVGAPVGVYSNLKSHSVMRDFLCQPLGGEVRTSSESLFVEWVEREDALARIIRPVIHDRMRDMMEFTCRVIYRAYEFDAAEVHARYAIH